MKVAKRNEDGLHCRFCRDTILDLVDLYETSPIKGIVCEHCMNHLNSYLEGKWNV